MDSKGGVCINYCHQKKGGKERQENLCIALIKTILITISLVYYMKYISL